MMVFDESLFGRLGTVAVIYGEWCIPENCADTSNNAYNAVQIPSAFSEVRSEREASHAKTDEVNFPMTCHSTAPQ